MARWLLFPSLIISANLLASPDHCYDFTSTTVIDGCGSLDLTRVGKDGISQWAIITHHSVEASAADLSQILIIRPHYPPLFLPLGLQGYGCEDSMDTRWDAPSHFNTTVDYVFRITVRAQDLYSYSFPGASNSWTNTIEVNFAARQWVYVYAYSDANRSTSGFGTYVPNVGTNVFQNEASGVYSLASYVSSYFLRFGSSQNLVNSHVDYVRKAQIYSTVGISKDSTPDNVEALINGDATCPRLKIVTLPACSQMYVYYKMLINTTQNSNQEIIDYSGNNNSAVSGDTSAVEVADATLGTETLEFNGSNYLTASNLNLPNSGYSIELWCKLDAAQSGSFDYLKLYSNDANGVSFQAQPISNNARYQMNSAATSSVSPCTDFNSKFLHKAVANVWVHFAVSYLFNSDRIDTRGFCNGALIKSGFQLDSLPQLNEFKIGDGFIGQIKQFKIFKVPMASQTFLYYSSYQLAVCTDGEYESGGLCESCDDACATCNAGNSYNCESCAANYYEYESSLLKDPKECVSSCPSRTYLDSSICKDCISDCQDCNDAATCVLCALNFYKRADGQCHATCLDKHYTNPTTRQCEACSDPNCKLCDSDLTSCLTCDQANSYFLSNAQCIQCAPPLVFSSGSCIQCDPSMNAYSYSLESGHCQEICGDGLRLGHECDDANTINGDGCSDTCVIEAGFACSYSDLEMRDLCSETDFLFIQQVDDIDTAYQVKITLSH